MGDNRFQTRLPQPLASEVEELEDEHGLNTSQAMRQLIQHGVEHRRDDNTGTNPPQQQQTGQFVGWALLSLSVALSVVGAMGGAAAIAVAAAIVFLGAAARQYRAGSD